MADNPKVLKAFSAMKDLGIPAKIVKPILKELLKVYYNNWELIEEDNYRTLADAIFEWEENKVCSFINGLLFVVHLFIHFTIHPSLMF